MNCVANRFRMQFLTLLNLSRTLQIVSGQKGGRQTLLREGVGQHGWWWILLSPENGGGGEGGLHGKTSSREA
jgi:hypothetical protein